MCPFDQKNLTFKQEWLGDGKWLGLLVKVQSPLLVNKIQILHPRYKHAPSLLSSAGVKNADLKEVNIREKKKKLVCLVWYQLFRLELENQGPCLNSALNSNLNQAPTPLWASAHFFPQQLKILCNLIYAKQYQPRDPGYVENKAWQISQGSFWT